jgi:predicted nucleic acid-binding protein
VLVYLDASALVKRYVAETGSQAVASLFGEENALATSVLSRVETVAALAKAVRVGTLVEEEAAATAQVFRSEWIDFIRIQATELVVARADQLAWRFGLRGYDAVHLASAVVWQENMHEAVIFATYDRQLWQAGVESGLSPFPETQP